MLLGLGQICAHLRRSALGRVQRWRGSVEIFNAVVTCLRPPATGTSQLLRMRPKDAPVPIGAAIPTIRAWRLHQTEQPHARLRNRHLTVESVGPLTSVHCCSKQARRGTVKPPFISTRFWPGLPVRGQCPQQPFEQMRAKRLVLDAASSTYRPIAALRASFINVCKM